MNTIFKPGLIILFSLSCLFGYAQPSQALTLSEHLERLTQKYQAYFSYDVKEIGQVQVDFKMQEEETLEAAFQRLLEPLGIQYQNINDRFFVLEKANQPEEAPNLPNGKMLKLILLDEINQQGIENVFVFIKNSSRGVSTDLYGQAILNVQSLENADLVITHLNYETLTVPIQDLQEKQNIVYLSPKVVDLEEVTIQSNKLNARKRKRWMRRFEKAFFGETKRRDRLQLLNPEVLWFEETDSTLKANAIDYLSLINPSTAYQIRFYLEDFTLNKNEDLQYVGKVFFEDQLSKYKNKRRVEKKRDQYYLNSKTLFFHSLVKQLPINEERFEFGVTRWDEAQNKFQYEPLAYKELLWVRGIIADTLYMEDYLTVLMKKQILVDFKPQGKNGKSFGKNLGSSFLKSKTGKFIIQKNGQLLNPKDIEESGYWAQFRLATDLPIDFKSPVTIQMPNLQLEIIDSLTSYRYRHPQEKVYIHTNQATYSNREQMWFKAYLVNAVDHRPVTPSSVVHIELISPDNEVVQSWMLHRDRGLHGDFTWTRNQSPGVYRLRAYTQYMRNQGLEFFFEQNIQINDYLENASIEGQSRSDSALVKAPDLFIDFFPEGGDLVAKLPANVAFSAYDQNGQVQDLTGTVIDSNGKLVTRFKTFHEGIGLFSFTPQAGLTYQAQITFRGQELSFELPRIQAAGFSLQVNPTGAEDIYLNISTTAPESLKGAFLVGHVRGALFSYNQDLPIDKPLKFKKTSIPEGVVHFTLFDRDSRPQAERVIYNGHSTQENLVSWGLEDPESNDTLITLNLTLDSTLWDESVNASLTILNSDLTPYPQYYPNIRSYFLLNSDLKNPIASADYYLSDITTDRSFYLDLLLMCRTWTRFTWKDLINPKTSPFTAQTGYGIKGYTTHKGRDQRVATEVMLNSFDDQFIYKKVRTDSAGNFSFQQLPGMDSTRYILQARISRNNETNTEGKVNGNRLVDFHLIPRDTPEISPQQKLVKVPFVKPTPEQVQLLSEKAEKDDIENKPAWLIDLDEVSVKAKRTYTSGRPGKGKFYLLDAMTWIPPTAQGTNLLNRLAPRYNFILGPEGKLMSVARDFQGFEVRIPVTITIDGMGAEPGGSNALPFLNLSADNIASIVVTPTYIGIQTRPIARTREAYLESGILQYMHPAYAQAREFIIPRYQNKAQYNGIHWEPQVRFDASGSAKIQIDKRLLPKAYEVRLEGLSEMGTLIFKEFQIGIKP